MRASAWSPAPTPSMPRGCAPESPHEARRRDVPACHGAARGPRHVARQPSVRAMLFACPSGPARRRAAAPRRSPRRGRSRRRPPARAPAPGVLEGLPELVLAVGDAPSDVDTLCRRSTARIALRMNSGVTQPGCARVDRNDRSGAARKWATPRRPFYHNFHDMRPRKNRFGDRDSSGRRFPALSAGPVAAHFDDLLERRPVLPRDGGQPTAPAVMKDDLVAEVVRRTRPPSEYPPRDVVPSAPSRAIASSSVPRRSRRHGRCLPRPQ